MNIDSEEKMTLNKLLSKQDDILLIESFLSSKEVGDVKKKLLDSFENNDYNLKMDDGIFFPFPYSSVHKNFPNATDNYFKFSKDFNQRHSELIEFIVNIIEDKLNCKIHPLEHELGKMSELNTRILFAQKNGIDIHCENAFIYQLEPNFLDWLERNIDLRNSLSFLLTLQKPEQGGELILFNQEWDNISFELGHTGYKERHDINGSIFTNRGAENISHKVFDLNNGDAIFFRAAQIWHAVNKIEGQRNRITIGCFIAKGYDDKVYYWA